MDAFDKKIIQILQSEPEIKIHELATRVALSHTPCWRRVKILEEKGIIARRAVILNPELLGLLITAFAHVRMKSHEESELEAFEQAALSHPNIVECFSMAGESDFILRVIVGSISDYELFLKKHLLHMPGVGSVNTSFALKCIKLTTELPV